MSQDIIETREYAGCTIKTYADDCAESPREWDNLGIIVGTHGKYDLCDEDNIHSGYGGSYLKDFLAYLNQKYDICLDEQGFTLDTNELEYTHFELIEHWANKNITYLPVYMYDHSGIAIKTTPFGCRWDSGQIGYIYCDQEKLNKMGTPSSQAERVLKQEINVYDQFVRGNVYGVVIVFCCCRYYDLGSSY